MKKTVVIADDHGIVRKGIMTMISNMEELELAGEASDGIQAIALVEQKKPDILLVDISMPGMTGLEVLDSVREQGLPTKVIILSMHSEEEYVLKAINAGASGYLLKNSDDRELQEGLLKVASGQSYFSSAVSQVLVDSLRKPPRSDKEGELTSREMEVLRYIVEGLSNKEIADKTFISTRTVDKHRAKLMRKLNARNAADLVRISFERKLLD